jgi:hypothetical protein
MLAWELGPSGNKLQGLARHTFTVKNHRGYWTKLKHQPYLQMQKVRHGGGEGLQSQDQNMAPDFFPTVPCSSLILPGIGPSSKGWINFLHSWVF